MAKFDPNVSTLAQCLERIRAVREKTGVGKSGGIYTSRDGEVVKAIGQLQVDNVPPGFNKWMLPFATDGPATFYLSFGSPNTEVPEHSHEEGDGIRIILSGSIEYGGKTLGAGDWMYLPAGTRYSFRVGPMGVGMCYCYRCCCAPL